MISRPQRQSPFTPLEGTDGPRRALFIKRWGGLIKRPTSGFPSFHPELLTEGALECLFRASQAGWLLYLVGNEGEVCHGHIEQETWDQFESELLQHLSKHGISIVRSYACTDDPINGVSGHRKESVFSLPNTGAMHHARQAEGVDLRSSWVIGDENLELVAGWRAGCLTAGIASQGEEIAGALETDTAFTSTSLCAVIEALVTTVRA